MNKNTTHEKEFIEIIEQTTDSINGKIIDGEVKKILTKILETKTSINSNEAQNVINNISTTIDLVADNFDSLKKAKKEGQNRTTWLKNQFDDTIETFKIEDKEAFIGEIKDSLQNANSEIGTKIFGTKLDISEPLKSKKYEDLNKMAIVNDFQNEIKNNTLLGAVIFENGKLKIDKNNKEVKVVKDYFEAKLDSPQDKLFKKAISTATVIGQKKGILPKIIDNKTPDEIALIVDKGVTAAKVAYKLGKGELSPIDAVEYKIDRSVAILNSAITKTCTRTGGVIGGKVGAAVGSIFGPAGTVVGAAIGTVVGKVGGYAVGKYIGEGVKKVATAVKSVVKKAWSGVKSVASSIGSGIKSIFSGWW